MKKLMDYHILPIVIIWLTTSLPVLATVPQDFDFLEATETTAQACSAINSIQPELRNSYLQLTKNVNTVCQSSAYHAFKQMHQPHTLLIDTRHSTQYQKVSIPGSLNIPLHAIKTKAFLKNKQLFLINDGTNSLGLNQVCHELRDAGFQVQMVVGGLTSWSKLSQSNVTDPQALAELDKMSPEWFYYELLLSDSILIALTESLPELDPLFHYKTHTLSSAHTDDSIVTQLKSVLKHKPMTQRVFIYDQKDAFSPQLKKQLKEQLRAPVFYLKGGAVAYKRFRQNQLALLKRLKYPPQSLYRCRG